MYRENVRKAMHHFICFVNCKKSIETLLFVLVCFFSVQCSSINDTSTGDDGDLVKVTVDLQSYFKGLTLIKIDNTLYFSSFLSGVSSFAGPQASFITYLSRGKHTMEVRYQGKSQTEYNKTFSFELLDAQEYFIGLRTNQEEDLLLIVQENPFGYL